jgi:uncharacterized protein YciI
MSKQFIVHLSDKQKHLMTKELIIGHVEYLRSLKEKGKLPFCGPCVDGTALMILKAESQKEAKELLEGDPFSRVGYYQTQKIVEVQEATFENNFHLEQVLDRLK